MLYWDTTKTGKKNYPASGIKRVADRLLGEIQAAGQPVTPVKWDKRACTFTTRHSRRPLTGEGTFITPEIFEENDRRGFIQWAQQYGGRKIAIFHDAIPIRLPQVTWPDSVVRHPHYMKLLGTAFDKVLAVSKASQAELLGYWKWLQLESLPGTDSLQWGADFDNQPRSPAAWTPATPLQLLQVGILEPRKNQTLTLDACETLWEEGLEFHLHLAGRPNPHFGKPIVRRIRQLRKAGRALTWHKAPAEPALRQLYAQAHLCLFPSMAEGSGLPVLESLWAGRPVLASNLDCILENASFGGVETFDLENNTTLADKLRSLLSQPGPLGSLAQQAQAANLPIWKEAAAELLAKSNR